MEERKNNLVLTRVFDAPSELVFRAWTEPERLVRWWGAKGFTTSYCKIDLRPGGVFHYHLEAPNGRCLRFKGFYREIEPASRLVFTNGFVDENGEPASHPALPDWPRETVVTVTFTEQDGKTTLDLEQAVNTGSTVEFEAFGIGREGARRFWAEEFDKLAEDVASGENLTATDVKYVLGDDVNHLA